MPLEFLRQEAVALTFLAAAHTRGLRWQNAPLCDLYFNPRLEEFAPRTMWSLGNSFTSAFKELDPIPQFRATAKLAPFLEGVQALVT